MTDRTNDLTPWFCWRSRLHQFQSWDLQGIELDSEGQLQLTSRDRQVTQDSQIKGYAYSPEVTVESGFQEAIASWNALTPKETWIEIHLRIHHQQWTGWYSLGIWSSDPETIQRRSVRAQRDEEVTVSVDILKLTDPEAKATAFQLRITLVSQRSQSQPADPNPAGAISTPIVTLISLALSDHPTQPNTLSPGDPHRWGRILPVPAYSQMIYPKGGKAWCSPVSLTMVLDYWNPKGDPPEARIRAAVQGVYDWHYKGYGNWPFNTAYAHVLDPTLEAFVIRVASFADLEPWIQAGIPVVISYAWKESELTGAPIPSSRGHLGVLVGFDPAGHPILNDPAASQEDQVQRTYDRAELELLWQGASGGMAYGIGRPHSLQTLGS